MRIKLYGIIYIILLTIQCHGHIEHPKVSIITSMYKSKKYLQHFLEEIVKQTIFDQCEFIIINPNSPDTEFEEPLILEYQTRFSNLIYVKLKSDPGIYSVWNLGIKIANAHYITNANVDDRLAYNCYEILSQALDENPQIDLIYSDRYQTDQPNISFYNLKEATPAGIPEFSIKDMLYCLPGPFPMWRKSLHEKYGLFNENFKSCGDLDLWLTAVMKGAIFKKINKSLGVFFTQTDRRSRLSAQQEQWEKSQNLALFQQILAQKRGNK